MDYNSLAEFPPISWKSQDGSQLTLRPLGTDDVDILLAFVSSLSYGTRYFRFGSGDLEFNRASVEKLCALNNCECVHFLTLKVDGEQETVVASAYIVFKENETKCEVAIAVADAWQLNGIGKRLMEALLLQTKARHMTEIFGKILVTNKRMIGFMRRQGFAINNSPETSAIKIAQIFL